MNKTNSILRMNGSKNVFRVFRNGRTFFKNVIKCTIPEDEENLRKFQESIKNILNIIRKKGPKIDAFYVPIFQPSIKNDGGLAFESDKQPAKGETIKFWEDKLSEYPGLVIGTTIDYQIYRCALINSLNRHGMDIINAMKEVIINDKYNLSNVVFLDSGKKYCKAEDIYTAVPKNITFLRESVPFIVYRAH